jgi:hypothetical protein
VAASLQAATPTSLNSRDENPRRWKNDRASRGHQDVRGLAFGRNVLKTNLFAFDFLCRKNLK